MFSLIVCTVDRTTPLERLLRSLALQTDREFEVVLVDQNQDDRLQALVESFGKIMPIVHVKAARGLSFARNKGLSVARGDFIAFPDDDCHYPRTLIEQVRRRFASSPDIDVLTGRTTDTDGNDSLSTFRRAGLSDRSLECLEMRKLQHGLRAPLGDSARTTVQ